MDTEKEAAGVSSKLARRRAVCISRLSHQHTRRDLFFDDENFHSIYSSPRQCFDLYIVSFLKSAEVIKMYAKPLKKYYHRILMSIK